MFRTTTRPLVHTCSGRVLNSAHCNAHAVEDLVRVLEGLAEIFEPPAGLPIGPEASAPLGTIVLRPLDRLICRYSSLSVRWMDDYALFVAAEADYLAAKDWARHLLGLNGQGLNLAKCRYEPLHGRTVRRLGTDEPDASLLFQDDELGEVDDPAQELEIATETRSATAITRCLGQLRTRQDPAGVTTLSNDTWALQRFPKQAAQYLDAVRNDIANWEPFLTFCLGETDDARAAAQMRVAKLLRKPQLGGDVGEQLFDKGISLSRAKFAPLANELFAAAGRSQQSASRRRKRGSRTRCRVRRSEREESISLHVP